MKTFQEALELKQHGVESLIDFQNVSKQHPLVGLYRLYHENWILSNRYLRNLW
jgi:Holliday junction resolvase